MLKMILAAHGGILLTNDGNAILRELDVAHPAAKSMLELSRAQDEEVGDGTTSVVVLGKPSVGFIGSYSLIYTAGELLKMAAPWLEKNLHPSEYEYDQMLLPNQITVLGEDTKDDFMEFTKNLNIISFSICEINFF